MGNAGWFLEPISDVGLVVTNNRTCTKHRTIITLRSLVDHENFLHIPILYRPLM
jgi:hypothetical protein